jgi:NAD(P)-dependent dehydrogenase (short-subunit alcohol dehydrogenase family)
MMTRLTTGRVNAICPGFVKTPFIISSGGSMEQFEQTGAVAPLGRCATADEIGRSIAFLLSEDASFITGSVLTADGGYTLSGQTLHM